MLSLLVICRRSFRKNSVHFLLSPMMDAASSARKNVLHRQSVYSSHCSPSVTSPFNRDCFSLPLSRDIDRPLSVIPEIQNERRKAS
ncbi:hypothetical protein NPIL_698251 [Nephila pilipes]|uniref:Uncharacterized protein n=1 Tax=Nephila pilipes TaxID=299642 RepID=A0A8X6R4W9_NEPPI|nr:hypothetical protein NPIL_698251 [Nephila pilipes]